MAIVEDDPITSNLLASYFEEMGLVTRVAGSIGKAKALIAEDVGVYLLDINLPDGDGRQLIDEIRARTHSGIILLTRRDEQIEKVVGLELGADDYVVKPFEPRELLARVKALIRRVNRTDRPARSTVFRFGGWTLDTGTRELVSEVGHVCRLTRMEYTLLQALLANRGRVMSRDELMDAIGKKWAPLDRTVDVLVGRLRTKLSVHGTAGRLIETVYGTGYLCRGDADGPDPAQAP